MMVDYSGQQEDVASSFDRALGLENMEFPGEELITCWYLEEDSRAWAICRKAACHIRSKHP